MDNKVKWANAKPLTIEKCSMIKLDLPQDYYIFDYCTKKITSKFRHKQRMKKSKFIAALYYLYKLKHPRFIQKATRKNLTRRKYGT